MIIQMLIISLLIDVKGSFALIHSQFTELDMSVLFTRSIVHCSAPCLVNS